MPVAVSAVPDLDIQGIFEQLGEAGVEYIVIGGVAVGFHGYVRATKDLDIVPAPDRRNLERLVGVLRALQTRLGRFDVMQWLDDAELWHTLSPSAVEVDLEGLSIKVAGYDDLVALKRQAGRPGDLEDLERMRQARGE